MSRNYYETRCAVCDTPYSVFTGEAPRCPNEKVHSLIRTRLDELQKAYLIAHQSIKNEDNIKEQKN